MKKKIINGILMVALMFATTSSFVSCKDNVDDDISDIYNQLSSKKTELEGKLADLRTEIDKMQKVYNTYITEEITQIIQYNGDSLVQVIKNQYDPKIDSLNSKYDSINNQLAIVNRWISNVALFRDSINNVLNGVDSRLNGLDSAVIALNDRIDELEKLIGTNLVTGLKVDATWSPVFGAWNLPMVKANSLAAFYGTNDNGIEQFPVAGYDFEVGGRFFTCYLEPNEIGDEVYEFEGRDYITNLTGNAGKVFFTVYPNDLDISEYDLTIENSVGAVNPIKLSNIKKSDATITWTAGKASGWDRTGKASDNGFYEADATIDEDDLEATKFGIEKFINLKKLQNQFIEAVENVRQADAEGHYKVVGKQIVREASAIVFDLFHNELNSTDIQSNPSYSPQRLVISQTKDDIKVRKYGSDLDIFTTAVVPLSYNTFYEYEKAKTDNWIIEVVLERAISRIAKEVKERYSAPALNVKITEVSAADRTVTIQVGGTTKTINISNDDEMKTLANAVAVNGGLDNVNNMLYDIMKEVSLGKVAGKAEVIINNYLDKMSNYLVNLINKHAFTRAVAPIIIFQTTQGVDRLAEGMFIKPGIMHAYLTSATYELIVPAFKKYVAVVDEAGNLKQSALLPGDTLEYDIDLSEPGDYKVILSCVDYFGFTVTKKYTVHVL